MLARVRVGLARACRAGGCVMAALIMPHRGGEFVCWGDCVHRDCAEWRRRINAPCVTCGKPVKEGERFFGLIPREIEHAHCLSERVSL